MSIPWPSHSPGVKVFKSLIERFSSLRNCSLRKAKASSSDCGRLIGDAGKAATILKRVSKIKNESRFHILY